jgi:hypothetical protein
MINGTAEVREIPLELEPRDVWAILGNPDRVLPSLSPDIDQSIALARELCEPRGLYRRLTIDEVGRKGITFEDGPPLEGKFLAHCFEGAEEAIFVLLTIGPALEKRVSQMFADGDTVEAFILDAVGSASAMNLLTTVLGEISEESKDRGSNVGTCLSPGQSYWDVTGQDHMLEVLPGEMLGVELLESSFLRPQKSQSALVPIGPNLKVLSDPADSFCRYCPATNCPVRKEPQIVTEVEVG